MDRVGSTRLVSETLFARHEEHSIVFFYSVYLVRETKENALYTHIGIGSIVAAKENKQKRRERESYKTDGAMGDESG